MHCHRTHRYRCAWASMLTAGVDAGETPARGHYVARVRQAEDQWLEFDDRKVSAVPRSVVFDCQAYVLLYEKV